MKKQDQKMQSKALNSDPTLLMDFRHVVGQIVDRQIEWVPGQNGRWDISPAEYSPAGVPQIKFSGFPAETILTMRSANHNVVKLGLDAAALAISLVAWNWVIFHAFEAGRHEYGRKADEYFKKLQYHIFRSRKSGLTDADQFSIHRYID